MLGNPGLRRWVKRTGHRLTSQWLVFVHHRVAEPADDPWSLAVVPGRFDEQLQVLRAYGAVMALGRMLRELDAGTLPRRAVAITFDDGYADTLHAAKPLLERHDLPAIVYLSPGLLDGRTSFWWDVLTRIIFATNALPEYLDMVLGEERMVWTGQPANAARLRDPPGAVAVREGAPPLSVAVRWDLYRKLWSCLRHLPPDEQRAALGALAEWAGSDELDDAGERPLSRAEAAALADGGLVEIGAHTLTHASLPACDHERKRAESHGSKAECEAIAGARIEGFSYPYADHDARTVELVREAGFTSAVTTAVNPLRRAADRFRLPRIPARDWDGAELERRLATADFL